MRSTRTLQDVADLAGVSIGTASSALNNRPTVLPETRTRVVDAAIALGYPIKSNLVAKSETDIKVVGLMIKHNYGGLWQINPFYSRVQLGVANACSRNNISLMYADLEVDQSNRPYRWPLMLTEGQIDGLILAGAFLDDTVTMIQNRADIPIVLVDSYSTNLRCDSIVTDNWGGACLAMEHLIENNHTKIGLVGWNTNSPPSIQGRKDGYLQMMSERGLEALMEPSQLTREDGFAATRRLFATHPEISAIFACNDETALGVLDAARAFGRRVPHDLSVVGFDNIDLVQDIETPLTTVHVHKSWMGTLSVNTLIERANHPEQPRLTKVISTYLVARNTVARL